MTGLPESFAAVRASISGSPRGLMGICAAQATVLLVAIFFGNGDAECEVVLPPGGDIELNCAECRVLGGITWRDFVFLCFGLGIIGMGFLGAYRRDKDLCRTYATIMTVYGFIIGLTATLTWLQAPVLEAAVDAVPESDPDCRSIGRMMVSNTRWHAFLLAAGALLDFFGAVFAMQCGAGRLLPADGARPPAHAPARACAVPRSVEYFDYEEINEYHTSVFSSQFL